MLLVMFVITIVYSSVEVNIVFGVFFLFSLLGKTKSLSKKLIEAISPLIIIILFAALASIFHKPEFRNVIKDFVHLFKPVVYIILGYLLIKKIKDRNILFTVIIYLAALFAILHFYKLVLYLMDNPFEVNSIRNNCGLSNYLEMISVSLFICNLKKFNIELRIKWKKWIKVLIFCSFVFYFSRTMFVGVFLIYMAINGYSKITPKGLTYILLFIGSVLTFYFYLFSIELQRGAPGIEGFLYKVKIAPSEIFIPDENIDIKNHSNLWDHWRAYEASKALQQLEEIPYNLGLVFGHGLGALIDLGFEAPLGGENMRYIAKIHNGYIYVVYKSGLVGLILYFLFLINIYLYTYKKHKQPQEIFYNNMLSGIAIYFLFTSLIIGGTYNQGDVLTLVLGGLMYLRE